MGKPLGSQEHEGVALRELRPEPLSAGRRARTQVDDHVEDGAASAAGELGFLMGRHLVMQAAQRSLLVAKDDIELHHIRSQAMPREFVVAPAPGKKSAM